MRFVPEEPGRLEFLGVSKWYGQVSALMDVGFEIGPGVTGLVGRNGAGKSTLMKLAAGLLRPSQGDVLLCGSAPHRWRTRRRAGVSPDLEALPDGRTGHDFVAGLLRVAGTPGRQARARAGECLDTLGLADVMHHRIATYSKGMRQRVRLAQAIAHEPPVVLLDEPMNGLDPVARHELAGWVRSWAAAGAVVLVSSHVLHELEALADRVLLVHQGRLRAEGRVDELRGQIEERPHRLFLVSPEPRRLAAAVIRWPEVQGVVLRDGGVEVSVAGGTIHAGLTGLGADEGWIEEVRPVDDSLAAVFGYLVEEGP